MTGDNGNSNSKPNSPNEAEESLSPATAASPDVPETAATDNKDASSSAKEMLTQLMQLYQQYATKETLEKLKIPLGAFLVAIVATGHTSTLFKHVVYPIYWLCLRVIAVSLGVALGLGFTTHVYDQLEIWAGQHHREQEQKNKDGKKRRPSSRKEETQALLMEHLRGSVGGYSGGGAAGSEDPQQPISGRQLTKAAPTIGTGASSKIGVGDSSYVALMASAGYEVDPNWKRGQVVRSPLAQAYPFCDEPSLDKQYAIYIMSQEWPTLPEPITRTLGRFTEFIMRDYVSTWYSMIDYSQGILYPDCVQRAKDKVACLERGDVWKEPPPKPPPKPHTFPRYMVLSTASTRALPTLEHIYRTISVVFGNLAHRVQDVNAFRLILLKWTKVIAHTFKVYRQLRKALLEKQSVHKIALFEEARSGVGRAAVRQTVKVLKASTKVVPNLNLRESTNRDHNNSSLSLAAAAGGEGTNTRNDSAADTNEDGTPAFEKTPYQPVSEMALTREFLVTGKLHPAVTFGLEIPSLLFADPTGEDCGTGVDDSDDEEDADAGNNNNDKKKKFKKKKDEDKVLEERLFRTKLLLECELDYNRVVSSRIIKLLLPRQDYGSPIFAALMTEVLGGCVLTPVMSMFSPDYLNDWIRKGMDTDAKAAAAAETTEQGNGDDADNVACSDKEKTSSEENQSKKASQDKQPLMRNWADDGENKQELGTTRVRSFSDEGGEMVLDDCLDQEGRRELGELMDLSSNEVGDIDELNKEVAEEFLGASASDDGVAESSEGNKHDDDSDEVDDDDEMEDDDLMVDDAADASGVYKMITLLDDALLNLQRHVDLEDCRQNNKNNGGVEVNWDDSGCKAAVLRLVLVVEALMLHGRRKKPIRIALSSPDRAGAGDEQVQVQVDETVHEEFNAGTLTQILMDLTSDVEAFETMHVKPEDSLPSSGDDNSESGDVNAASEEFEPSMSDLSTLRTLISAWLHTGQVHHTISTLARAKTTVLRPFYHGRSFLRNPRSSAAFTRHLKILDGVDVMVDTVAILSSSRIDPEKELQAITEGNNQQMQERSSGSAQQQTNEKPDARSGGTGTGAQKMVGIRGLAQNLNTKRKAIGDNLNDKKKAIGVKVKGRNPLHTVPGSESPFPSASSPPAAVSLSTAQTSSTISREFSSSTASQASAPVAPVNYSQMQMQMPGGTPRYLEYHRNEAFASSLRSERDRRMQSWITSIQNDTELIQVVTRIKGATQEDISFHRELHHVARIFYAGTNMIGIRDAARTSSAGPRQRLNTADSTQSALSDISGTSDVQSAEVSLLTVEMACARRRIEVPDDDSSFLLRAQVRTC